MSTSSRRSLIRADSANAFADKLDARILHGRRHDRAEVWIDGTYIGSFGIRRGTNAGHPYIPNQIFVNLRQALDLARCPLSKSDYVQILKDNGKIPTSSRPV